MHIVKLVITISKIIASIAAVELNISSCQRESKEQRMRRGDTHHFYRGPLRDHVLRGRGYRNDTTRSYLTCAGTCLLEDACKSFNFCPDDKRCELNSGVYSEDMSDLQFSSGCLYFDEKYPKAECVSPEPLGLEDRTISDDRMSASSVNDGRFFASWGRLNNCNWWAAATSGPSTFTDSWIEVDLGKTTVVSGVITQGDIYYWRVTHYKVAYKKQSSSKYTYVTDFNGDIKVFEGNIHDSTTPVTNIFARSFLATVVRIKTVEWYEGVAMRLELLGCHLD